GSQLPYSVIPEWAFALWASVSGLSVSTLGFYFSVAPSLITLGLRSLVAAAACRLVDGIAADAPEVDVAVPGGWWTIVATDVGTFAVVYAGPLLAFAVLAGQVIVTPLVILRFLLFLVSAVGFGFRRVRGVADLPGVRGLDEIWDLGC